MSRPVVVIVGPPGVGKTTIGRAIAARRGLVVRETDDDIVAGQGKPVADIFLEDGEPHFRELEHAAVVAALAEHEGVLSLGGGAVMDPRTQEALRGHTVIFLDVRIHDAAARIGLNRDRPLLLGNPRAQWTILMEARRPIYTEVASARVVTDGLTIEEVTEQVLAALDSLAETESQQVSEGER